MPTIRIDEDVWKFLQSKAKPFEDSPNDVLRRELGLGRPNTSASSQVPGPSAQHGRIELLLPNADYTFHRVSGYALDGKVFPARTFKDVLIGVSGNLRVQHLQSFDKVAMNLRGTKRVYFSLDPKDLRSPFRVPNSNIFAETNLNANLIAQICATLVKELGHDLTKFEIR